MHRAMGAHPLFIWALALFVHFAAARSADPIVKVNRFHNMPARLFLFDDAATLAYYDQVQGTVYISGDEGSSWAPAQDLPGGQISTVIPHPFNNRIAFALTDGREHFQTDDCGNTWRRFRVPAPPAWVASPLAFHSDRAREGYILYQGRVCDYGIGGWGAVCYDETYYVKEAFSDLPKKLLSETRQCMFAHSTKTFVHEAHKDLIYCVAFDTSSSSGSHSLSASRLYSSTDFFEKENKVEGLGIGKDARGVVALAIVSKFAVVALKDTSSGGSGDMLLYVTSNAKDWARATFPHASAVRLRENAYTIVESTTHSLGVEVILDDHQTIGTFFVSDSNGTHFVESLADTNRNDGGFVDFEQVYGVDGVGIANVVTNAQDVEARRAFKQLASRITFDDGCTWSALRAPARDVNGESIGCDASDAEKCSLHLHSVTVPHNLGRVFSSPAPGFVMGVGSVGPMLRPYTECDTFLSTDAGATWTMVSRDAHIYEFGDQGSIIVAVKDEDNVSTVRYSVDRGKTWEEFQLSVSMHARALVTIPDASSQRFMLLGQLARENKNQDGGYAGVFLDFAPVRSRQCGESDIEKWWARTAKDNQCIMGHKQWYWRRKPDADCYIGKKFEDTVEYEVNCPCEDDDYECDFNYVLHEGTCVPLGSEPISADVCKPDAVDDTYLGSSGYRLIPGNTCDRTKGVKKDERVKKPCSQAEAPEGQIQHQEFKFPAGIAQHQYFKNSQTLLVLLQDYTAWQSSNEGYTWTQLGTATDRFVAFYMHPYSDDRAYLVTSGKKFLYTTNQGRNWHGQEAPTHANTFQLPHLSFHPAKMEYIIWTGEVGCDSFGGECYVAAAYSPDNGRDWKHIERYVRRCEWARDAELKTDSTLVMCESYKEKTGDQRMFRAGSALALVAGSDYYNNKREVFGHVAGFTKFSEFLVVAEVLPERGSLDIQVSLDGKTFTPGMFPPNMKPDAHSFTILESSTDSLFVYKTISETQGAYWGSILKSNSNGTYFSLSANYVNRVANGFVDFERMIGLDGIALINVVSNPKEAALTGRKELRTRITHNDGGSWSILTPPTVDSEGQKYQCSSTDCALHLHGYTERFDPRATYSTPSVPGLLMAVGNVGKSLKPYAESDTFISRDAGFTWEEVHKDAHLWEFGDSGSVLVAANDQAPTDHLLFTINQGKKWREYKFSDEKVRVRSIVTSPQDTSRKFIVFAESVRGMSVAIQIDFSSLTRKTCVYDEDKPMHDDFELWSPAAERVEACLFGRQMFYLRRKREANCKVGNKIPTKKPFEEHTCQCANSDFECDYNHARNLKGECELIAGQSPLPADPYTSCDAGEDLWYERTPYRKIAYSKCDGGPRPDRGAAHACPRRSAEAPSGHGFLWWLLVLAVPFAAAAAAVMVAWVWRGRRGAIRLPTSADDGALIGMGLDGSGPDP